MSFSGSGWPTRGSAALAMPPHQGHTAVKHTQWCPPGMRRARKVQAPWSDMTAYLRRMVALHMQPFIGWWTLLSAITHVSPAPDRSRASELAPTGSRSGAPQTPVVAKPPLEPSKPVHRLSPTPQAALVVLLVPYSQPFPLPAWRWAPHASALPCAQKPQPRLAPTMMVLLLTMVQN